MTYIRPGTQLETLGANEVKSGIVGLGMRRSIRHGWL